MRGATAGFPLEYYDINIVYSLTCINRLLSKPTRYHLS